MNSLIPVEQKTVNFNGTELMAVKADDGKIYAGVKWFCQGLFFDKSKSDAQVQKIQADLVLSKGACKINLPTMGGSQETLCIELGFLPLWLAKINANIIEEPKIQERLVDYQINAKDVLANAFLGNQSVAPIQNLSPQLQLLINMELKQKELEQAIYETKGEIQAIRDVVALNPHSWRDDSKKIINKIAQNLGGNEHIKDIRSESYELLNARFGVSLETRITNMRRRMADEGVCKSKQDKLSLLDAIAGDKKLVEGYVAIIKEMAIKYGVTVRI